MIGDVRRGAIGVAGIVVLLAGCSSHPGGSPSPSPRPSATASPSTAASPTSSPSPAPSLAATPSPPSSPTATSTAARCHTKDLALRLNGPNVTPTDQYQVRLEFTNISAAPCTLDGFPGLELTGPSSNGSTTYDPIRQAGSPSSVLVAPGLDAVATLTALPGPDICDNGTPWVPYDVTVIPPDETTPISFNGGWVGYSVDNCQGGATHPGTYIGAIAAGTSASPPPPYNGTGAGPFAGTWIHHGVSLTVSPAGDGTTAGVLGRAAFTVSGATATTATVNVTSSTQPSDLPRGPSTMVLDVENGLLYWLGTPYCGPKTTYTDPCGA